MSIVDLLLYVDNNDNNEQTIQTAQQVAENADAHLTGVYVVSPPYIPVYSGIESAISAAAMGELQSRIERRTANTRDSFENLTQSWQSKVTWLEVDGEPEKVIPQFAQNYDLTLISQGNPIEKHDRTKKIIERVALGSGRPVLILPYAGAKPDFGKRILIAWNDSRESTRAVHDALPYLKQAEVVDIAAVNPSKDEDIPCAEIAEHLSRHGVNVEVESAYAHRQDVGKQLLTLASTFEADMIVMGAYGHLRFTDMVLGGATRYIMEHMSIPVLMSH